MDGSRLSFLFIALVIAIVTFALVMMGRSGIDAAACRILGGAFHEGLCADRPTSQPLYILKEKLEWLYLRRLVKSP